MRKIRPTPLICGAMLAISGAFGSAHAQTVGADGRSSPTLEATALKIAGVEVSCNILMDDSLEVQGKNTTNRSYDCDVTCNLQIASGASAIFNCTPVLPANTANGSLCKSTGPFRRITGGKYSCK